MILKNAFVNYGVGVDTSKDSFHGCFSTTTQQGDVKVIAQKKFKNNLTGHKQIKVRVEKNRKNKELNYQILLEVTGIYHEELLFFFT